MRAVSQKHYFNEFIKNKVENRKSMREAKSRAPVILSASLFHIILFYFIC